MAIQERPPAANVSLSPATLPLQVLTALPAPRTIAERTPISLPCSSWTVNASTAGAARETICAASIIGAVSPASAVKASKNRVSKTPFLPIAANIRTASIGNPQLYRFKIPD
ncbi:MAG TPA: hypothetical protein PLR94_15480 [Accumulibacter sp.]|uniref:hypothetical protein n=1 Tax=Accumulibacter sp. TaxID=2053492 RepID=UPI00287B0D4E|nr:hypothetical protein [Accumulibacter sp.]MDS4074562.1 hypothetical protein [Accumulibacter sp.]HMW18277.1 hypothetical protein [Accumulibacter sp.]HNC17166.1 hypothetical protein [Accumulibacter sp.]HNE13919.1 hypothetical protein [Accumulibacter sp.]HNI72637.1 hypothetical protein [Accumulibacter sp.]